MLRLLIPILLLLGAARAEELRIAVLGNFPENKGVETLAAQYAVEAANASDTRRHDKVKLAVFNDRGTVEGALEAAKKIAETEQVLGVVVHGEPGADASVLKVFEEAGLAVVAATSWTSPRPDAPTATWLSPSGEQMAASAAAYARKAKQAKQLAVIDNGAPTSQAQARAFAARFKELGGRVDYMGEWQGSDWGLTRTVKELAAHWPQTVFFAGEAKEAGLLIKAMRKEGDALKAVGLLGLPVLFDPAFINTARTATKHSVVVFPHAEYNRGRYPKYMGISFPNGSPADKAYRSHANRPGRWAGMVFDGTQLILDAMERAASAAGAAPAQSPTAGALAEVESPTAQASPEAQAALQVTRAELKKALSEIENYKGIQGRVSFSARREPTEGKIMVFTLLPSQKNSKEMRFYVHQYGPPFSEKP